MLYVTGLAKLLRVCLLSCSLLPIYAMALSSLNWKLAVSHLPMALSLRLMLLVMVSASTSTFRFALYLLLNLYDVRCGNDGMSWLMPVYCPEPYFATAPDCSGMHRVSPSML